MFPVEPSVPVETTKKTPCADCTPATHGVPTPTPKGSVEAETGTPNEDVTPPSTDTLTPTNNTPSNDGWQLVLVARGRPARHRAHPDPGQPQGSPLRDEARGPAPRDPSPEPPGGPGPRGPGPLSSRPSHVEDHR